LEELKVYKTNHITKHILEIAMHTWKTSIKLQTDKNNLTIRPMKIKHEIFQGDTQSAL